jgi:CPA1 family monovalent cation:H+ antiporter
MCLTFRLMPEPNVVVLLVVIATAVALLTRRLPLPYTMALLLTGIGLGALRLVAAPHLTRELLFAVFLPGLVFEAAFHLSAADLRRNTRAIVLLAVPGVAASITITAAILVLSAHLLGPAQGLAWTQALAFGAIVAATDPIAVVSLVRSLGAPPRLALLLEAESLLNDGTAIAFFGLVLAALASGRTSWATMAVDFVRIVGVGTAVGLAFGFGTSLLGRTVDEAVIEITLTVIAGYGSFVVADQAGGSGVIAAVVAGVVCGNYGAQAMSAETRVAAESFWTYVAFLLNSIVFLLMGFEVHLSDLAGRAPLIAAALVAGWISRTLIVGSVFAGLASTSERVPATWIPPLVWGGLRGALSMVLALSLPAEFAGRELVVTITFGFVVLSILLQGTTMAPLLRRSGLVVRNR